MSDKSKKDIISEEEYNSQVALNSSTDPEEDSPGDSESDAGMEFSMGLNYEPDDDEDLDEAGDEPGEITFGESESEMEKDGVIKDIPSTAKVISSEQPEPWKDLDTSSDVH